MFDTGNILYFKNFHFNNGNESKVKYFIVLGRIEDRLIIGSLPTRSNKIPSFIDKDHGCVNKDERCFNCYLFQAQKPICENGFFFDLPTFVYGNDIEEYDAKEVANNYKLNDNSVLAGKLYKEEFNSLLNCFANSNSVKNKFRRILSRG